MNLLRNVVPLKNSTRSIWGSLNAIFNRVSKSRIDLVGPDRACAEWLMRNGAFVRWKGQPGLVSHYNFLPLDPEDKNPYFIEEISAVEASISHHGFDHFKGCNCILKIQFQKCWYLDDTCLKKLELLANSLIHLEIDQCTEITNQGLLHITSLSNLLTLKLGHLDGVKNLQESVKQINAKLPNCHIMPPSL
ncbi:ATP synthase subunit s, mitochondrial [Halyomorpha halys]|uniref:ATP synthase subunit s, mitochondrial n=1 Tax=Halyomorpha halys TaxID=286706 RepID=UPI0006D50393|nr:ATP synthase subunit s, mitochondrial [Halyomorpha halys]